MTPQNVNVYMEGKQAFKQCKDVTEVPYKSLTQDYEDWLEGYYDGMLDSDTSLYNRW